MANFALLSISLSFKSVISSKRNDNERDEDERSAYLEGAQRKENLSGQPQESRRFEGKCYNCGKKGHVARNCWSKTKSAEGNAVTSNEVHKSEDEWDLEALSTVIEEEEVGEEVDMALTATVVELVDSDDEWIDNLGSSSDETKDMKELSNPVEYTEERTTTVDNLMLPISDTGEKESAKEDRFEDELTSHRQVNKHWKRVEDQPSVKNSQAHRSAARSSIFRNMLDSDVCKAPPNYTITLPEFNHDELSSLLEFLYRGYLPREKLERHVYTLLVAADKYEIPFLKRFCEIYMLGSLSTSNALDVLEISDTCSNQSLKDTALNFIVRNMEDVVFSERFDAFALKNPHLSVQITRAVVYGGKK
ncbi:BTB/POZ domain-containing protein [Striga hermonthica]|uniref:BTB/POZ domain-containing protein n=1 Tax=Striga hermonthica TaxID=68872 RepID=A0A9N7R8V2_STRHE|nr:BTB/POZ domain-containing protein [Striga hermonthica]